LPDDPLSVLETRIATLRAVRAAAPRFSDAFWEADDLLTWLRVARDEVLRSGRLRDDVIAFLGTPPIAVRLEPDGRENLPPPALAIVASDVASEPAEPIVAA
jgi:hypothetical protein